MVYVVGGWPRRRVEYNSGLLLVLVTATQCSEGATGARVNAVIIPARQAAPEMHSPGLCT